MLMLAQPLASSDLLEAIALMCSPVFGALHMANALGGAQTAAWSAVRSFSLAQLIDEAVQRGLDLFDLPAACVDAKVVDTPPFWGAVGYDPRPRCTLCGLVHLTHKDGTMSSCGRAASARLRMLPPWRWTRASIEAALSEQG